MKREHHKHFGLAAAEFCSEYQEFKGKKKKENKKQNHSEYKMLGYNTIMP